MDSNALVFNCIVCGSANLKYVKDKEVTIHSPNPGDVPVTADCYECQKCHEIYFDESASRKVAKQIDVYEAKH